MFFSQYDKGSLRKLPLKMVMVKSELPPSPPSGSHLNCLGDRVELSKSESISGMGGAVGGGRRGEGDFLHLFPTHSFLSSKFTGQNKMFIVQSKKETSTSPLARSIFWGFLTNAVKNHPLLRPWASLLPTLYN